MLYCTHREIGREEIVRIIRPVENFKAIVARSGLALSELARLSGVSSRTVYGFVNPGWNPNRRLGGVMEVTAWKVSSGYAKHMEIDQEEAFNILFTVEDKENDTSYNDELITPALGHAA
jgi:hypothetical protein